MPCGCSCCRPLGEGHVAAARALSEGLRALGTVDVVSRDGLSAFGAVTRHMIRDGYRWQLRWAPWTYSAMYWLVTRVAPCAGGRVGAGRRRPAPPAPDRPPRAARRGRHDPPRADLRPRSDAPAAQARDPAVCGDHRPRRYRLWAHRGADLHLVMHEHGVAPVELVAGAGSAALVRPIVAARFLEFADRETARRRLGLRVGGRLVAVSGGGSGVGDLRGAVDAALGCDDTDVVVLAGRNETRRASLEERYDATQRVHVWGFTERMDDVLRAADVAVHSTGGV